VKHRRFEMKLKNKIATILVLSLLIFMIVSCASTDKIINNDNIFEYNFDHLTGSNISKSILDIKGPKQGLVSGRYYRSIAQNPDEYFKRLASMNVSWFRIEFEEHMPGNSMPLEEQIQMYKTIIEYANKYHIKILGLVGTNSMPDRSGFPKENQQKYVDALKWYLETYKLDAVEICNEPLIYLGNSTDHSVLPGYALTIIKSYEQLKPLFPEVLFVAPVTANAELGEWLGADWRTGHIDNPEYSIFNNSHMQEYMDNNSGNLPLDIISWHPYGSGGDPLGNFYFGRNFKKYYEEILNYEDIKGRNIIGSIPIWFTEYGWSSHRIGEDKQSAYYSSIFDEFVDYPQIEAVFWYTFQDDDTDDAGSEGNTHGLIANKLQSYRKKDVYYSFVSKSSGTGLNYDQGFVYQIIDLYEKYGGISVIGNPVSYVVAHSENIQYQIFSDDSDNLSAILLYDNGCYIITHDFFHYFFDKNYDLNFTNIEKSGYVTSNMLIDKENKFYYTEKGFLLSSNNEIIFYESSDTFQFADPADELAGLLEINGSFRMIRPLNQKIRSVDKNILGLADSYATRNDHGVYQIFSGSEDVKMVLCSAELFGDVAYFLDYDIFNFIMQELGESGIKSITSDVYEVSGRRYVRTKQGIVVKYEGEIKWF